MNPNYEYRMLIFIGRLSGLIRFSPQAHAGAFTGFADEFYACGFESFTNKPYVSFSCFHQAIFRFYSTQSTSTNTALFCHYLK